MNIKILGCSGGIGGAMRTTSLLVDDDVLIDAGTGVGDLSLEALCKIDHIFLTHSHLDHIACIPLLIDTVMGLRVAPVTLHASADVISTLKQHIFNWLVWPDFNAIPNAGQPFLQYQEIGEGSSVKIGSKTITALPANHVVPAMGYLINNGKASLAFTGDTAECAPLWQALNAVENLKYLIIETAFSDAETEMAKLSKHLCPTTLASELANLRHQPAVFITHLKPGEEAAIMQAIAHHPITQHCMALQQGQVLEL